MTLKRDYKIGTLISFKWYDNWRDQFNNPNNFRIIDGIIDGNYSILNQLIVFNGHENNWYSVPTENIIKEYEYETTNQEKGI